VTLTPEITGTSTAGEITPGGLSAAHPQIVNPCNKTTYFLTVWNSCGLTHTGGTPVVVPGPDVLQVSPTTVAAGESFTVIGTGFSNPTFCSNTEVDLKESGIVYPQSTLPGGTETSVQALVNPCVQPGRYDVLVKTAVGTSPVSATPVTITITAPKTSGCTQGPNVCVIDRCMNNVCQHISKAGERCSVGTGPNDNGNCVQPKDAQEPPYCNTPAVTTPPPPAMCVPIAPVPAPVADQTECVPPGTPGPQCCSNGQCLWGICVTCIPHGGACGQNNLGTNCCAVADSCVASPVTGATVCDVLFDMPQYFPPDAPPGDSGDSSESRSRSRQ
jgi:hypothetical protein